MKKLPKEYILPNPYNIPVHDQGNKNNCTSHAVALAIEYQLSDEFEERVMVDVDDLWRKQREFGTATEEGDSIEDCFMIATEHGVRFSTESGKKGTYFLGNRIELDMK